jgi:hypothetical protein
MVLHGVGDLEDRERLTTDWDLGRHARERLTHLDRRDGMATRAADRPVVDERRTRCQAWLLGRVRAGVTVETAIRELVALHRVDPGAYAALNGDSVARSVETFRKYWQHTPLAERNTARALGRATLRPG